MYQSYQCIARYLESLQERHGIQICIKDFSGFIPINKELNEVLQPFLAHINPFCMYMKSIREHYFVCLSMIRRMHDKCVRTSGTFFGLCHAGLGEYVVPIRSGNILLGAINAGFFQTNQARARARLCRTCKKPPSLDLEQATRIYAESIREPNVDVDDLLVELELLAEYLGQTYFLLRDTHSVSIAKRYQNSSEDTILAHAIEYIRQNFSNKILISDLASFCHCSESYVSRIFKRRTGLNINLYVNKIRIEQAKNHLLMSEENISMIAASAGFNDPNYFSRVFTQIIGISPTEFRRRFQQTPPGTE